MRRQKTAGRAGERRFQAKNRPPEGEPFYWMTLDMVCSPAMQGMTLAARRILDFVIAEHMQHAGTQNGSLPLTYDQLAARGIRRQSIPEGIEVARRLGWLDVVAGGRSYGSARRPSEYRLTWLPKSDGSPPTNRWKAIQTLEEAESIVASVSSSRRLKGASLRSSAPSLRQDIRRGCDNAPREPGSLLIARPAGKALPRCETAPRATESPGCENAPGEMPSARAAR